MSVQYYVILSYVILLLSFQGLFCCALCVEACNTVTAPVENCISNEDESDKHLHLSNLCKRGASVKEVTNKYEEGNLMMKQCDASDVDFDLVREHALGAYHAGTSFTHQKVYPFECENVEDTIEAGIGTVLLNSGYPQVAIDYFSKIIEDRGYASCVAWYFGRASAYRKLGLTDPNYVEHVLTDYTNALLVGKVEEASKIYEARAEVYTGLNQRDKAYDDYTSAIKIEPDYTLYLYRGVGLVLMEKYYLAYGDLQESLRLNPHQSTAMHYLASCLYHLRRVKEAIDMFKAVLLVKPHNVDVMLSLAQTYMEIGDFHSSLEYYNKAGMLSPANPKIFRNKAQLLYNHGNIAEALAAFGNCVSLEPYNRECRMMIAKCYANLGQFYPAIKQLTKVTRGIAVQNNLGYFVYPFTMYLREWCRYIHMHLDSNVAEFDVERDLHKGFKENWTRDSPFFVQNYTEQPGLQPDVKDLSPVAWSRQPRKLQKLLCYAYNLGKSIHMQGGRYEDSVLGNVKAYLASGLASIEISQALTGTWNSGRHKNKHDHRISWKSPFEIAVKWLRLVDLSNPVFWVDDISPSTAKIYTRRYGLIQHNITDMRFEKYYPEFFHIFTVHIMMMEAGNWKMPAYIETIGPQENFYRLLKTEMRCHPKRHFLHTFQVIRGRKDKTKIESFNVLLHEERNSKISVTMEVSLGWARVERFHDELDYIWQKILEEYRKFSSKTPSANSHEPIVNLIISLSYYFLNLFPLSRSNTVVSHSATVGLILALGRESTGKMTRGRDLTLEALTNTDHNKFRNTFRSWLSFKKSSSIVNGLDGVAQTFPTLRSMQSVMQYDLSSLCKTS